MSPLPLFLAIVLAVVPNGTAVSVAYAGSLVHVMEGPFARALERDTGVHFSGEGKGSKMLAHLIEAGLRTPDVFISADSSLLEELRSPPNSRIRGYAVFGSARMVLGYSEHSRFAALFAKARESKRPLLAILTDPAVRIGRTDPQVDPKGARTVKTIQLLGSLEHAGVLANALLLKSPLFPEEDLAVRVESGELDAGFFYSTEIAGRGLRAMELPPQTNLSHEITYGIAILIGAANRATPWTFERYLLYGRGRSVLQAAGIRYFNHPEITGKI